MCLWWERRCAAARSAAKNTPGKIIVPLVRVTPGGFVFAAMSFRLSILACASTCLFLQSVPARAQSLPSGADGVFRAAMLDWTAAAQASPPLLAAMVQPATPPAPLPRLSSEFGDRRHPIGGRVRHHAGIDIPGAVGTAVLAAAAGEVRRAGHAGGYGIMVEIAHPGGLTTRYAHLSQALAVVGTRVTQGQAIGAMGSTGHSTGSHLHFEVRRAGVALDPLDFLGRGAVTAQAQPVAPLEPLVPHRSRYAQMRDQGAAAGGTGS